MMGEPPCFVVGLPPLIEATDGDIVTLQVRVTGNPEPSVTWYHCGDTVGDVPGKRDLFRHDDGWYEFVVTNTNEEDEGEYECKAENVYGCASTFGDLYYYSREYSDSTKEGSEADYTRADDNDEFNGRQSGLLILIDDGSQTDDDSQDRSLRRSLTASEQMQGIIEDLTQDDGSVTLGRDDFGSDRDLIDPADQMLFEGWHHTNAHYQSRNHGGHAMSDSTWDSVRRPGNRRASGTCRSPAAESVRSGPASEPATSWYPQLSTTNESFGDLSSDNVSSLSTPDPESTFTCVTPFADLTNVSTVAAAGEAAKTENASVKSKKSIKFWDIVEEDEDHVKPRRITPDGLRHVKAQSPGSEDTSAKMSSFSKSSIKSSSYVGEESVSKTSIRSSRLDSTDLSSSALSSVRRSTAITSSFDADDDLSSSFRRSSRTSALDDDVFGGAGTRRSLRSRLDDDADSGIASIRRTSGLGSRDDDLESTLSSARRLTSRLSSKDEDESSSPAAFRVSSRTSSKDEEDGMLVKRSTKMSSSREEDDRYSLSKTKFSSSIDAEDENSSLSVRTKKSSMSYKEEDTSGSSVVKSSRSALSYSESFSSETKVSDVESVLSSEDLNEILQKF